MLDHGSSCKAGSVSHAFELIFDQLCDSYDTWSLQTKGSTERGCGSTVKSVPRPALAPCAEDAMLGLGQAACGQGLQQPLASLLLATSV